MRLRLQSSAGRCTLTLEEGATLRDLRLAVATKLAVAPGAQVLKCGYPAQVVASEDDDAALATLGIKSGETVLLEVTKAPPAAAVSSATRTSSGSTKPLVTAVCSVMSVRCWHSLV